ncbi:MAG: FG-GAP-like repeat-containing protein, partial [Planctomycetota bacterium]
MSHLIQKTAWCTPVLILLACAHSAMAQNRKLATNDRLVLGTATRLSASVRAGDIDGDGDLDLVVANGRHWPQQNLLFLNHSRGRFTVERPLGQDRATSYACELADLDGDGDLDIAVGNDNAPCLVFLNDGLGKF